MNARGDATKGSGAPCVAEAELQHWLAYLEALDCAGQALDRARRLVPDHGLDHGVDRLRALLLAGAVELERRRARAGQAED